MVIAEEVSIVYENLSDVEYLVDVVFMRKRRFVRVDADDGSIVEFYGRSFD